MTEQQNVDIEGILRLHKNLWDETTKHIDISRNGNMDIAKTIYAECCAYLRGQMMDMGKNRRMEEKRKEEQERFNTVFQQPTTNNSVSSKQLGTTKGAHITTPSTAGVADLPQKFNIVDPRNPDKTLYNVENGMAIDHTGTYKGTLEPRAGRTGPYYLLKGIGILTKNKNNWYLKDKQDGKWVTIGVLKT